MGREDRMEGTCGERKGKEIEEDRGREKMRVGERGRKEKN